MLFPFVIGDARGPGRRLLRRLVDTVASWLVDVVVAFPFYVLIIALVFALGPGTRNIYIAITIVGWVSYTRIVRGEVPRGQAPGVRARRARRRPLSHARILLPAPAPERDHASRSSSRCPTSCSCILAIVTLGYLGLGVQPPTPDWGADDRRRPDLPDDELVALDHPGHRRRDRPALGLSLLADGLADLLRPE